MRMGFSGCFCQEIVWIARQVVMQFQIGAGLVGVFQEFVELFGQNSNPEKEVDGILCGQVLVGRPEFRIPQVGQCLFM